MMKRFADIVVKYRKSVIVLFAALAVICVGMQFFVQVNYNMADYLPADAQSTKAIEIMGEEFTQSIPNTSVMIRDISVAEALEYKQKLSAVPGVTEVIWLDDMADIMQPLEMLDQETVGNFYKERSALYAVTIAKGSEQASVAAIRKLDGAKAVVAGEAPDMAASQQATSSEAGKAMIILLPVIILILVLSTTSWVEPILFLVNIGVSILINMGTNLLLGEISFISFAISPILQMACSLDYAIFLLHSFGDNRKIYQDEKVAMRHSITESISTIAASAVTTLFGFLALAFMKFQIGSDLGICLAKGIVISFICSIIFLPAVTLCAYKWIDRTGHREWTPNFRNVHKVLAKISIPVILLVCVTIVPCFLGQSQTGFVYGTEDVVKESPARIDADAIKEHFGQSNITAVLVPRGDVVKEQRLCEDLKKQEHVTSVMAYVTAVGTEIPPEYLGDEIVSQFYSGDYTRIIVYTNTKAEGDAAFAAVEQIQQAIGKYYPEGAYSAGNSANLYDMKQTITRDNNMVNLVAIIAIFGVLLITFRSGILPLLLLITIETGIWVNLSIPYFTGTKINFMGYLVLSTVQLGATVDYAILLTAAYIRGRQQMPKKEAIHTAVGASFKSILVSGLTLATAGFILAGTTSNPSIHDIGQLLGRGTVLSMVMVLCFLPSMLALLDAVIEKTTYKAGFYHAAKSETATEQIQEAEHDD